VLAAVVGDQEAGEFFELLIGFRNVSQVEVGNPAGERQCGMPADKPLFVPGRKQGCDLIDFLAVVFRKRSHEHHLLKHVVGRVVRGLEERELSSSAGWPAILATRAAGSDRPGAACQC
jgi:hypothetical protein